MSAQQYREVKRKAAVGERIKIVNKGKYEIRYTNGAEFYVEDLFGPHVFVKCSGGNARNGWAIIYDSEYVVLEPIAPSPLTSDPLYAAFRQFVADNADELRKLLPVIEAPGISVGGIVDAPFTVADSGAVIARTPKLNRAEVIAKATADVAELMRIGRSTFADLPEESPLRGKYYAVEFYVNRDKRAVTALVKRGSIVYAKFTAKCSPADVFHAEIGKAIALRRTLGLAVPSEYTDAPQPEKALNYAKVTYANERYTITPGDFKEGTHGTNEATASSPVAREGKITDDTDVDYSAVSTKGVAA